MATLTESAIETFAIKLFERLGYDYIHASDIAPDSDNPERRDYAEVLLVGRLEQSVNRINANLPADAIQTALKDVRRAHSPDLLSNNEAFHRLLSEGVPASVNKDGDERGERVWLIDFAKPENNEFLVVSQFTVIENHQTKRPDLLLFVNGLPLVVIELKNAAGENATLKSAYQQLETYKQAIPSLFTTNAFVVISDGLEAKAGSLSAGLSRFMAWKSADGKAEASHLVSQLETLIVGMLNKTTLLDLLHHFIVFEKAKKEDSKTGQITITTVKKLAAYHQYYAVNAAIVSTLRAVDISSDLDARETALSYGLPGVTKQPRGDKKAGVVWHTQGSGKSLSMVFYTGKIALLLNNPTILVITDRNDLDDQLFDTFAASKQLLRQEPVQAKDREDLKALLKVASGGVVFSTIQKFQPEEGNVYEELSDRRNIVVIADEAHRTQYGFAAKTVDEKSADGTLIGKKVVYGFAKYLRDALPCATYLGFTGTPIEKTDVNTPAVFGNYVDVYDIAQAVEDGATVRIYYESRLAKVTLSEEGKKLIAELDEELDQDELSDTQKTKARWTRMEALIGSEKRINNIAHDIVAHFDARQEVFTGKGMVVSMSRRIAAQLYNEIIKLRPQWHSDELTKGVIKVVMTAQSSDGPLLAKHHTTKEQRKLLAERMKDDADPLKLVIVRDMWLTGFDAPSMHTLYIDKPMKGHNLMQAIARVNRVHKDKPGGLVVDYLGIASDLKEALSFYSDAGGKGDPTSGQEQAVALMLEKIEIISAMYHGFAYENFFEADTAQKLALILAAEEHILGLDDGRKRYINEVTALSKCFAIAIPHEQALDAKDEVGFFQAVKARLVKFDGNGDGENRSDEDIETTIRQVIDKALVSEQVIDVFDAAGIKKPDISILSEEFLAELKDHKHKNVALEVLKKLLNDELKARAKKNLVQSKSLMEMLENAIKKYHNKILTAAEVMDELIKISKEIVASDDEAKNMGLTDFEYAFYSAVANNDSARELMEQDKLRELAVVLTLRVRENASIDWTIKESVKAKLKVIVKRTLRQFGYPPDMQLLATETVLKQAEMIARELVD
ncbi:type I restriction endonuclease subunit R [Pseudomonas coronafaciens]|uniref:type I restriction endonuclease subunit R n=1 Tax=Pseudomonas coronafaciens TaxID=53409 RepID=UPI0006D64229|nr:type I restriction endonuclease subunit R [Pseudomonas coronafaciens]KPZ21807.1 Type I site-specific deoxyribonuclease, HsdR family [Pseudomonas coronafaciens pv. zizaniae]